MATIEQQAATGVSFDLTDEQRALRSSPASSRRRRSGRRRPPTTRAMHHPADMIEKAHAIGLMNLHVPEEYGGPGLPTSTACSSARSSTGAARGWAPRSPRTASGWADHPLRNRRAEGEVARPLIDEPILCSFALTEPGAGSDVASMKTNAERRATSTSSTARRCSSRTRPTPRRRRLRETDPSGGARGISAFIVDGDARAHRREAPRQDGPARDRHRGVSLDDVRVPAANRLGEEGDGFKIAMETLDGTRPGTARRGRRRARPSSTPASTRRSA